MSAPFATEKWLASPSRADTTGSSACQRLPVLTPRQRSCVILAALGLSDHRIAARLGISGLTAHNHIEAAKRRFGATTRVQLVVTALFRSEVSFEEIFAAERALERSRRSKRLVRPESSIVWR